MVGTSFWRSWSSRTTTTSQTSYTLPEPELPPALVLLLLHVVLARGPSGQWWQCWKKKCAGKNGKRHFSLGRKREFVVSIHHFDVQVLPWCLFCTFAIESLVTNVCAQKRWNCSTKQKSWRYWKWTEEMQGHERISPSSQIICCEAACLETQQQLLENVKNRSCWTVCMNSFKVAGMTISSWPGMPS